MKRVALKGLAAAALLLVATTGTAFAAWSASGEGSGASHATTMPTGNQPTAVPGAGVQVSWAQSVVNGDPVEGYTVSKEDLSDIVGEIPAGGGCAGLVTASTCTESSGDVGSWVFRITPRQFAWIGTEGAPSTPPVLVLP